jgi:AAA+ ATPase superfamily predicted ATPase
MFFNRVRERAAILDALRSRRAELMILYGRRGVGKAALLRQAIEDSGEPCLFYRATRRTLPLQMSALTDAVRLAFPDDFLGQPFGSFSTFLDFLSHKASARAAKGDTAPVVAIIDEIPYLADVEPGLLTVLQHWWDDNRHLANLKLFLAGSYMAFMERQVLDLRAPLYNRRTGAMKLEPMNYAEAALFFPDYSPEDKMQIYAVLGGMPSYLVQFDPEKGLRENIEATILRSNTYLFEEPDWLLLEELRRDITFGSILRAVAMGERKPSDIARAIGKDSAQDIARQLARLQDMALLVREVPVTERRHAGRYPTRSRNSLYFLADNYLDFWYRFVDPGRTLISLGQGGSVWQRSIEPLFGEYVSRPAFERACRQYLWRALDAGSLPAELEFADVGSWWGSGDREIDVVAVDQNGAVTLAGSCKWTLSPMDVREYAALRDDLAAAKLATDDTWLALFSRSGFTERLRQVAASLEPRRLLLVDLASMYGV